MPTGRKLGAAQAHVLANLDRVVLFPRKLNTFGHGERFSLDGKECTSQITGLVVRKFVEHAPNGVLVRLSPPSWRIP